MYLLYLYLTCMSSLHTLATHRSDCAALSMQTRVPTAQDNGHEPLSTLVLIRALLPLQCASRPFHHRHCEATGGTNGEGAIGALVPTSFCCCSISASAFSLFCTMRFASMTVRSRTLVPNLEMMPVISFVEKG